ncbi:GxxExxY protein [Flavobacterium sp. SUN046]|nr:GxxExxY protein [Flavobacterium sp. SUN046]
MELLYKELTYLILKSFFAVYNELGYGFLEKVYHSALLIELRNEGLSVESKKKMKVYYKGNIIGEYYPDIIVENTIIVELKSSESISKAHETQLLNYLKGTDCEIGLLLNFGKSPEFSRKVFENRKKYRE